MLCIFSLIFMAETVLMSNLNILKDIKRSPGTATFLRVRGLVKLCLVVSLALRAKNNTQLFLSRLRHATALSNPVSKQ